MAARSRVITHIQQERDRHSFPGLLHGSQTGVMGKIIYPVLLRTVEVDCHD